MIVALVAGCGNGDNGAGAAAPEWQLSPEPTLVIGEDGTPEGELLRVVTALPLPGDNVAVVDAGHAEIRVFDGSGLYQRTIGRKGDGPGEFRAISWAQVFHDTLVVYDGSQRRITFLGADGAVRFTILPRAEGEGLVASPVARLPGGTWVVRGDAQMPRMDIQGGVLRDTMYFGTLPAGGTGQIQVLEKALSPAIVQIPGTAGFAPAHFATFPASFVLGDRIGVAEPDGGTVAFFASDGAPQSRISLPMPRQPITSAELDRLRAAALDGMSDRARTMIEVRFAPAAAPKDIPAFRSLLTDGSDLVWFEEWQHQPAPFPRYHVVGIDGTWHASISMPPGFTPATIGPDWVLGVHRDADGVQRVMRYGLIRR